MKGNAKEHLYQISLQWTGNRGEGTTSYRAYNRSYEVRIPEKSVILGSSDPAFRGNKCKHNPEELFVAFIASCHLLLNFQFPDKLHKHFERYTS